MRKPLDYNELVEDYKKRFGKIYFGHKIKILHEDEIKRLHEHPSDDELKLRKLLAKKEICIYKI